MIIPGPQDALHKLQLTRLLSGILDSAELSTSLYFKGGTCAAMLGFLDRFSLDLDFDLAPKAKKRMIVRKLEEIFSSLELQVKQKGNKELFYILKYNTLSGQRNTLKVSVLPQQFKTNIYKHFFIDEIDRYANCATVETMFSNKLVSLTDRYRRYRAIAGRDLYDIHHFFMDGRRYIPAVIEERTGKKPVVYLKELREFIIKKITGELISQDLNYLLPLKRFSDIRKRLKTETLAFLKDEISRLS